MNYRVFSILEPHPGRIVEAEERHPGIARALEPIAKKIDDFIEQKIGINLDRLETAVHPQEDYLKVSQTLPIFTVADGVTLELNPDGTYPAPSGAGVAARIFCEHAVAEMEKHFDAFTEMDLKEAFRLANEAVGAYNASQGRVRGALNYWDNDLFAVTAAMAVFKDDAVYWASICDSFVAHIKRGGELVFRSPVCWPSERRQKFLPKDCESYPEEERKKNLRKIYRNGFDENGQIIGYGVVTGEKNAERYLNYGLFQIQAGETVALFTDGFESYMALPEFTALLDEWPQNLDERIIDFTNRKSREDPANFGHERSLIVVKKR